MNFEEKCGVLDSRIKWFKQKHNLCFILCDKFGTALRNSIPWIPGIKPDIIISERWCISEEEFVLENTRWVIGDIHYLQPLWWLHDALRQRIGNRKPKFFSWIARQEIAFEPNHFLCLDKNPHAYIEDKTKLGIILERSWIDTKIFMLKHSIFNSKDALPSFEKLSIIFGVPFVLQGQSKWWDGTIIVKSEGDFYQKFKLIGPIRVSEFSNKKYGSIYACVLPVDHKINNGFVIMDRPALKVVGVRQHGIPDVLWWGCDWGCIPNVDMQETYKNVEKIWLYLLRRFGYKWSFVLEWFFIEGRFVFNEINARLWWGNEVSGFNQILNEQLPIQAIHYALQLWIPCSDFINKDEFHEKHFDRSSRGCFYFKLLWKGGRQFRVWTLTDWPHSFDQGRLVWIEGYNMLPTQTSIKDWHIYISNLPRSSTLCSKDAHICMIEGVSDWKNVLVSSPTQVSWLILQISNLVYNNLVYA